MTYKDTIPRTGALAETNDSASTSETSATGIGAPAVKKEHLKHKHLLVHAYVAKPIIDVETAKTWIRQLIEKVGMNILMGPIVAYCDTPGNEGISGAVVIETSHSVIHIWSEDVPASVQFDLYSCSDIDLDAVWEHFQVMEPISLDYKFLDRETSFKTLESGTRGKAACSDQQAANAPAPRRGRKPVLVASNNEAQERERRRKRA
ncbi:MAG: S-adenosylmethionine decarboxylase [Alphaproteobacteria bacterium]|nr:S-adenosylmethionine decarboxylase [Alphaproteobacteria bacterium]